MKSRVPLFVLAVAALAAGCQDTSSTAPRPQPGDPSKMISDGAHHGGNPDFFFLPPIANDPKGSPNYSAGMFNPNLAPAVRICLLNTEDLTRLATAECVPGPAAAEIHSSEIHTAEEFYQVVWRVRDAGLDPDGIYRIQVFVGSTLLGFADMAIVNTKGEAKSAITNEVLPMSADRSLPIKFRIEAGALTGGASSACKGATPDCVEVSVSKAGGTFFTNTKWAGILLEPGWASDEALALGGGSIQLTIERVREKDGNCHGGSEDEGDPPASGQLWAELDGCYHYATDPDLDDVRILPPEKRGFQTDGNKVGQCTSELPTDEGAADDDYLLFKSDPGQPITPLEDTPAPLGLNCTSFAFYQGLPSNPILRFASIKLHSVRQVVSRFVVNVAYAWDAGLGGKLPKTPAPALSNISRGIGLMMAKASADNQSAPVGADIDVRVRVTTVHSHRVIEGPGAPKAGVEVTFTASGGDFGDGATSVIVITDENGEALVSWSLAAGTHTVTVTAPTIDPTPLTFTATGIANGAVGGTVYNSSGVPLSGAILTLTSGAFVVRSAVSNSLGAFAFTNIPPGTYSLSAAHVCCAVAQTTVVVTAGGSLTSDLILTTLADLVVSAMSVDPANPTVGQDASFVITVSNVGGTDAPASLGTFIDGFSRTGSTGQSINPFVLVPAIPAGGSFTFSLSASDRGWGTHSGSFTVNTGIPEEGGTAVLESNTTNNSRSVSYVIPEPIG